MAAPSNHARGPTAGPPALPGRSGRSFAGLLSTLRRPDPKMCALINLGAFPGLGTWIARRPFGAAQTLMTLMGFTLAMAFMFLWMQELITMLGSGQPDDPLDLSHIAWMGKWGFGLFIVSWLWAACSSVSLWKTVGQ